MKVQDTGENLALLRQRSMTYVFLSAAYVKELPYAFLEKMKSQTPDVEGLLEGFYAELHTADLEALRVDLAADYARLFLGMSEHPVAPFESVYTSEEGLLMQKARDEVLALFGREGLTIPDGFGLPEDHIALEFDFMAILTDEEIDAINGDAEGKREAYALKQKQFFTEHISTWIPRMCDDVLKQARTEFYRGLANLTKEFIEEEARYFERI